MRVEAEERVREEQRLEQARRYREALEARARARPGLLRSLGLYRQALAFWERVSEPDPAARERANVAITLADLGRGEEALREVAPVIEKHPTYRKALYARALAEYALYRAASKREYAAASLFAGWLPLGPEKGFFINTVFAFGLIVLVLGSFRLFEELYPPILKAFLAHKVLFFILPLSMVLIGALALIGFETMFVVLPKSCSILSTRTWWSDW